MTSLYKYTTIKNSFSISYWLFVFIVVVVELELPGPLVVVVVVVDWDPVSFPEGEAPVLSDVLPIESNVFSRSLVTALFMESVRL